MIANEKEVRQWHQLCSKEIDFSFSWEEWKERFDKARRIDELVSLLHYGFDVGIYDRPVEIRERIFFYLELAYGYNHSWLFSLPEDMRYETFHTIFGRCTVSDARQKIAQKAWAMLCQRVFKNTEERKDANPSWWWIVEQYPQIFDKILWFFSEEDNIPSDFYAKEHNNRIALDFLYALAELAWINHSASRGHRESPLPHFVENRPKFIKILGHLRKLDFLVENWELVTKEDLAVLEKIALLRYESEKEDPKYKTVKEAAVGGSRSARVLIVLRALLKENARQEKVAKAEIEMEEAKEKIKALNA